MASEGPSAAAYPWGRAAALAAVTSLAYLVLPNFAPSAFRGEIDALLMGVILALAVGVALRVESRLVPVMAVSATVSIVVRLLLVDDFEPFVVVVGIVVGVEIWLLPLLLRRTGAFRLRNPSDLARYIGTVVVVAVVTGALVAVMAVVDNLPVDSFASAWRSWAIDDIFGLVCITPAILTMRRPTSRSWRRAAELGLAVLYTAVTTYYVFFLVTPGNQGLLGWPYIVLLGSGWIAVRLGLQAVAPVLALQFWVAISATAEGIGVFTGAAADSLDLLLAVEVFAILMSATIISLAVLRDARLRSKRRADASSRLLREVIDGSDALIFAKSFDGNGPSGRYVLVNRSWADVTGFDADATIAHSDVDIFPPAVAAAFVSNDELVMSRNEPILVREENVDSAGEQRIYWSSKFPLRSADGTPWGVGGIASDITEVVRAQEREVRQAELLRAIFEQSPTPAVRLSMFHGGGLGILDANDAMCTMLAAEPEHMEQCDLMDRVHPDDVATAWDVLSFSVAARSSGTGAPSRPRELRMNTMDGRVVWVLMSAAAVGDLAGTDGNEIVAQFEDVTARRQAEEALSDQALRDPVTGLPNRRALHELMQVALQRLRRHPGMVTVLFCDLDRFKEVNDSLGHHVGDLMLIEVAQRLRAALRPEDTIARLGGDEFVALGEGFGDLADAELVAMRMQDRLGAPWVYQGQVYRPAVSIGIAATTDAATSVDELLRRADLAMYRAKEGGRNRIEVYERSVDEEIQQAVAVQHDLRRAIDTDGLFLEYQPIVELVDGSFAAAEALVRMRGRDGSVLSPVSFVPQAEASGLVVPMGAWVLNRALADLRAWRDRGLTYSMSVNVSPSQLRDEGFANYLLEQVRRASIDPTWLAVEVTETALIHDPGRSSHELSVLSRAGVGISLDDFGTGYSSLSWLTQFPVNTVKIDKSFTDEVGIDDRKTAIVSALIQVSHELGFTVVAEGIESPEQRARLIELGCDRGQGYLFGRPVPVDDPVWG